MRGPESGGLLSFCTLGPLCVSHPVALMFNQTKAILFKKYLITLRHRLTQLGEPATLDL